MQDKARIKIPGFTNTSAHALQSICYFIRKKFSCMIRFENIVIRKLLERSRVLHILTLRILCSGYPGKKYFEKRGKCWLPAFPPFLTMFLQAFFFKIKTARNIHSSHNSVPNNKILDHVTKFKAIANDKINIALMMITIFDTVENIVGKGENAG